jgi:transposase InsO family protein
MNPQVVKTESKMLAVAARDGLLVPRVIADAGDQAARRFPEFFAATIRNKNTRVAYYRARLHGMRFVTRRQAKDEVIDWLRFYNCRRLHSTLGYLSPMDFEKKRLAEKERLVA